MITALLFPVPVLGDKEATEDTFDHALEDSVATITVVGGGLPQGGTWWLIKDSNNKDVEEDMWEVSSWEFQY